MHPSPLVQVFLGMCMDEGRLSFRVLVPGNAETKRAVELETSKKMGLSAVWEKSHDCLGLIGSLSDFAAGAVGGLSLGFFLHVFFCFA